MGLGVVSLLSSLFDVKPYFHLQVLRFNSVQAIESFSCFLACTVSSTFFKTPSGSYLVQLLPIHFLTT